MWWKAMLLVILTPALSVALAVAYGFRRWQSAGRDMRAKLEAARLSIEPTTYDIRELTGLPPSVQSYFRAVLEDGQPMVAAVSVDHTGVFNTSEVGEKWRPFTSTQRVITRRPGFDWEGRIAMMPGLKARVHDAYIAGEGILHASLLGLVSLVDVRGTTELAQGELMRFLAEAAWYPTALLPSQGVQWAPVDGTSATATLKDGETTVKLLFRFDEDGLIRSVRAGGRGRMVAGTSIPTPWEGRWTDYELRGGMRIPMEGEVAWMLPDGPKPYWRGRITRVAYEFVAPQGPAR